MKKFTISLLAMALVVGGSVAPALAGPYFSVNAGAVWVNDSDLDIDFLGDIGELSYDAGYGVNAAFGNAYGNGVRSELELAYRTNDIDEISISGLGSGSIDGEVSSWGLMVNVYYDFDTGSAIKPFVGAGIGFANVDLELEGESDDDNVFAYQAMAGVGFAVSKAVTLDLQYRFYATDDPSYKFEGMGVDSEYMTHNVMAGLRFNF